MIKIIDKNDMYFFKKSSVCKVCSLQLHGLPFDMTEFRLSPDGLFHLRNRAEISLMNPRQNWSP